MHIQVKKTGLFVTQTLPCVFVEDKSNSWTNRWRFYCTQLMLTKLSVLNMKANRNPPKVTLIKCTEVGLKINPAEQRSYKAGDLMASV